MVALGRIVWLRYRHEDNHNSSNSHVASESQNGRLNEASPLLSETNEDETFEDPTLIGPNNNHEPSVSTGYLILLCLGMVGLQLAWAAELSNGSPFLLSLGMSKSLLAIVWIAGPLSGVLVQPIVGIWSDNCQLSWGRRRPFLVFGSAITVISLLCLSWTKDIVRFFGGELEHSNIVAQAWAVLWIYVLDFAVNVLQAALRAFIVDIAPSHQQDQANAWASRLAGVANILGYVMGYKHLPKIFPWLGNTQLKVLCAIGSIVLIITTAVSVLTISEKDPRLFWPSSISTPQRIVAFLKTSFTAFSRLPNQTQRVCLTQFFNWIGWFPFLFYISTYIGQLYVNPILEANPNASRAEIDEAWEIGTRLGAFALLTYAITSFAGNAILPFVIQPLEATQQSTSRLGKSLSYLRIPGLTIRRAWMFSHLLFAICMWSTLFIKTPTAGAVMTSCVGLCWAMTNWAPFALISADISQRDRTKRRDGLPRPDNRDAHSIGETTMTKEEQDIDQAGVVLGLHNVAVSAPQILATLIASTIFSFSQKDRNVPNDDSIAQVLRFGGFAALVACWASSRIA